MQQGKIARVFDKGFGFISRGGGEQDLFFHCSQLRDLVFSADLVGASVAFDLRETQRGVQACDVRAV